MDTETSYGNEKTPLLKSSASSISMLASLPKTVDRFYLAYWIFFLLGVAMLFPWNVFITATGFFQYRFTPSPFADNFSNYFGIAYNCANLASLLVLLRVADRMSVRQRVFGGLLVGLTVFVVTTALVKVNTISPNDYFLIIMITIVICGMVTALLQNGIFGLSSKFPPTYTGSVMTGQSLAGAVVSVAQILTSLVKSPDAVSDPAQEELAALLYFLVAVVILACSFFAFILLTNMPIYKFYHSNGKLDDTLSKDPTNNASNEKLGGVTEYDSNDEDDKGLVAPTNNPNPVVTYGGVAKKVYHLGFAVFFGFFVTLSLFPSVVSAVASTTTTSSSRIFKDLFVPFAFLLFNIGDVIGRATADWWPIIPSKWLWVASLLRAVYFPLMLLSNVVLRDANGDVIELLLPALITADWLWWVIVLTFGISNGYVASLAMMYGPQQVTPVEREKTGIIMINFLVWGLFVGSFSSFALRAILCGCNPFAS